AVYEGTLYLGGADGFLYALDARTGALRWAYDSGGWIVGSPAVNAAVVAAASSGGAMHLIDVKTGKKRLVFESAGPVADSPLLGDEALYAASGDGRVWAIDWRALEYPLEKGFNYWKTNLYAWGMLNDLPIAKGLVWAHALSDEPLQSAPALADGALYVTMPGGGLHALSADTGESLWGLDMDAAYLSAPTVSGATVLVGSERGLHAVDARDRTARLLHATDAPIESPPALAGGRVLVLTTDGTLTALR
ncbi:MAG: PQQ-binding-like beta-propeller repeat protein, partial [Chloroflexota bacterium]|nr:PQQ-binding-like beta-propeller repeat protein [Chloroflexota bacterium]